MALTFPITISKSATKVLAIGDSVVQGDANAPDPGQGLFSRIGISIWASQAAGYMPAGGWNPQPGAAANASTLRFMQWQQNGISGTGVSNLAANLNTRVLSYGANFYFWLISSNDWGRSSDAAWLADCATVANGIDGANPNAVVVMVSNLFGDGDGAYSGTGGSATWASGANNDKVASINTLAQGFCAGRDPNRYIWMNLRGTVGSDANTYLNWVQINNPSKLAQGGIVDSTLIHPTRPTGQDILAPMILSRLTVTA